jgi:hypothetical protein
LPRKEGIKLYRLKYPEVLKFWNGIGNLKKEISGKNDLLKV